MSDILQQFEQDCERYYWISPRDRTNCDARLQAYKKLVGRHGYETVARHTPTIEAVLNRAELQYARGRWARQTLLEELTPSGEAEMSDMLDDVRDPDSTMDYTSDTYELENGTDGYYYAGLPDGYIRVDWALPTDPEYYGEVDMSEDELRRFAANAEAEIGLFVKANWLKAVFTFEMLPSYLMRGLPAVRCDEQFYGSRSVDDGLNDRAAGIYKTVSDFVERYWSRWL